MSGNQNQVPKLFYNAQETEKPEVAIATGLVPAYVRGDFIRVGPGMWDLPEATMGHFIDGYAILFKFTMNGKKVSFEKKFLESDAYKRAQVSKKPVINEFGTRAFSDTSKSFFSRVVASLMPELSDNNYSTLYEFNSEFFVGAESGAFRSINPGSLSSPERHDAKKCFGCEGMSAHALKDENGDLYNMAMSLSLTALKLNIFKVPSSMNTGLKSTKEAMKKGKIICTLPNRRNGAVSFPHSFGMTRNYIIVVEHPHFIAMSKVLSSLVKGTTSYDWLEWHPEDRSIFYIIEKATGKLIKTEYMSEDPFYFMHFINCYEESDQLIVDINCYDSAAVIETLSLGKLRDGVFDLNDHPFPCRYVLPLLETRNVEEGVNLVTVKANSSAIRRGEQIILRPEILMEGRGAEMPGINAKYFGKKYSFYYMAGTYNPSQFSHALCKVNVDKKEVKVWKENEFNYPSEPIFVPNPNGTEEDDGIVISSVTDSRVDAQDFLLYLDAKTMTEVGRAYFTNRIPTGLHGIFIPTSP